MKEQVKAVPVDVAGKTTLQDGARKMGHSERTAREVPRIQIFVAAHKEAERFDCDLFQLVQVGSQDAPWRFPDMLHDDQGDSISGLNQLYCELTAQYWAWKNVEADYYGFCHYRRYFDFSAERHKENVYGEIIADQINAEAQRMYCLDEKSIRAVVEGCDVVTTEVKDLRLFPERFANPVEHYRAAPHLRVEDLRKAMELVVSLHPDYQPDVEAYLTGHASCFCNMFIMRRDVFFDYCAWLFPVLERLTEGFDEEHRSVEGLRTPGHLAERLLNVFCIHQRRVRDKWVAKQLQCVHFEHPERRIASLPSWRPAEDPCEAPCVIPLVLAANDSYVPMLTTTLYSVVANMSSHALLDVVVIQRDISESSRDVMQRFFGRWDTVRLRFFDASALLEGYQLETSNEHISAETYYRFLIPEILPEYDKVLYLDSDLVVLDDVAELFKVSLEGKYLAAVRDIDYLGNLNMEDGERLSYSKRVLGMKDPYGYVQAGVLVLNTKMLRQLHSTAEWIALASRHEYIYDDQDILNAACEGHIAYLDSSWNVMTDCKDRVKNVFSFAPASVYRDYVRARRGEKIVHYAGVEKPWNTPNCDRREVFWEYARATPYYEDLAYDLSSIRRSKIKALVSFASDDAAVRDFVEPILPIGSRRREFLKAVARKIRDR